MTTWSRIPKGEIDKNGVAATFDWGSIYSYGPDGELLGVVYACNHGAGWTVSFTAHGVPCDDQQRAEALAEAVAMLLPKWVARTVAERERQAGRLLPVSTASEPAATIAARTCAGSSEP